MLTGGRLERQFEKCKENRLQVTVCCSLLLWFEKSITNLPHCSHLKILNLTRLVPRRIISFLFVFVCQTEPIVSRYCVVSYRAALLCPWEWRHRRGARYVRRLRPYPAVNLSREVSVFLAPGGGEHHLLRLWSQEHPQGSRTCPLPPLWGCAGKAGEQVSYF